MNMNQEIRYINWIDKLEKALEFYANPEYWKTKGHLQIDWNDKPILHDGGRIAREVLGDEVTN